MRRKPGGSSLLGRLEPAPPAPAGPALHLYPGRGEGVAWWAAWLQALCPSVCPPQRCTQGGWLQAAQVP
jgi:hypothetical protein